MFSAGSNLKSKTDDEIFYQDFKRFNSGKVSFGVGQISSLNADELDSLKERLLPYLKKAHKEHGVDMMFFMPVSYTHLQQSMAPMRLLQTGRETAFISAERTGG